MVWQVQDLKRALHAEPGSAEALRLAALRADDVRAPAPAPAPATPATAPHHHTFDAVMQHHARALRTHNTQEHTLIHVPIPDLMHYLPINLSLQFFNLTPLTLFAKS